MICALKMPALAPNMTTGLVEVVYAPPAGEMLIGSKFMDVSVDLGAAFAQECPPISYYRIVLRERTWLRQLKAMVGAPFEVGATLAIFTTTPDEPIESAAARDVRLASAGIIYHSAMWSGAI